SFRLPYSARVGVSDGRVWPRATSEQVRLSCEGWGRCAYAFPGDSSGKIPPADSPTLIDLLHDSDTHSADAPTLVDFGAAILQTRQRWRSSHSSPRSCWHNPGTHHQVQVFDWQTVKRAPDIFREELIFFALRLLMIESRKAAGP